MVSGGASFTRHQISREWAGLHAACLTLCAVERARAFAVESMDPKASTSTASKSWPDFNCRKRVDDRRIRADSRSRSSLPHKRLLDIEAGRGALGVGTLVLAFSG